MTQATALHRIEYLAASLIFIGAALWRKDDAGWAFWLFLLAPDALGLIPASLLGPARARGYLPPRGVWLYNVWHTYTVPVVLWIGALLLVVANPWPLLGWLIHISVDRLVGFGLRGEDGGQAVF